MDRKPRVYLNSIRVESAAEPELLAEYYSEDCAAIRAHIRRRLAELVALPHVSTISRARPSDLALDVLVPRFEAGIWVFDMRYRLFQFDPRWRPWLEVRARLRRVVSGETVGETTVTAKLSRANPVAQAWSLRSLLGWESHYGTRDLDKLVADGCLRALDQLRSSTRPAA